MKTLRSLVKGGNTDETTRRERKLSLPVIQIHEPMEEQNGNLWKTFRRKLSFSVTGSNATMAKCDEQESKSLSVEDGTKKNVTSRRGNSQVGKEDILHFAITENDVELIKDILMERSVDVNYLRPPGLAPLHQACMTGCLEIVELLVRNGANIFLRDYREFTPLQLANFTGQYEIAEYLLRMGSPVLDIKDGFQVEKRKKKPLPCRRFWPR
eukprot:gene18553-20416_t